MLRLAGSAKVCRPLLSLLLLRSGSSTQCVGVDLTSQFKPGFTPSARRLTMAAFVASPAWVNSLAFPNLQTFLRGGGESEQCKFCTKAHGSKAAQCRAERIANARAAQGRRTNDGWALLSTMREPGREAKVGQPKGWDGYGWGSVGYESTGKGWEGDVVVLGIETSCDDTAAAVVRSDGTILGESKRSQDQLHAEWGGVVPNLAKNAHEAAIESVVAEALQHAGMTTSELDAVGVTMGPGLEICLRVGFHAARDVALNNSLPFVSVHHLEAHVLAAKQFEPSLQFPFLVLLVSGGHCQILLARGVGDYLMLGGTLDDSLGEAYDKAARMLGLDVGGGGGPALEALAKLGNPRAIKFGVPMKQRKDCHFSFAGLKTAVRMAIQKAGGDLSSPLPDAQAAADIAASFQHVAIRHLEDRLKRAIQLIHADDTLPPVDTMVVCGGVASNMAVRDRLSALAAAHEVTPLYPPVRLCTDNGVMVAWSAIERLRLGVSDDPSELEVRARWPLGQSYKATGSEVSTKHTKLPTMADKA